MPGPWDGPVLVVDQTPTSFRFATLKGHLEAGQIEFRTGRRRRASASRSSRGPAAATGSPGLLFDRVNAGQGDAAPHVDPLPASGRPSCPAAASAAASTSTPAGSSSSAHRWPLTAASAPPGPPGAARRWLDKGFNFDPDQSEHFTTRERLEVDDYLQPLPPEPPGPPEPGGSFEVAQRLMRDYEFADPAIVRAIYADDSPFERRDMLLEGRFCGLRFRFGVRVGGAGRRRAGHRRPPGPALGLELPHSPRAPGGRPDGLRGPQVARQRVRSNSGSTPSPARRTSPTRSSGSASGCSAAGSSAASPGTPACGWPA